MKFIKVVFLSSILCWLLTGCNTYKNIAYFKDLPDSVRQTVQTAPYSDLKIQSDDILNISIQLIDPLANSVFNQSVAAAPTSTFNSPSNLPAGAISQQQTLTGFLVDKQGEVELPFIGKLKLAGLTTGQARDTIKALLEVNYKMPSVNVRFANLKVNVLGEVLRPGTYILPNEKNTIFDALSLAGDLTIYGKRENLVLVRDSAGKTNLIRFSLNSKDLIYQDFFYLKQNDVIYVEPNKAKIANLDAEKTKYITIAASLLSVLIVLFTRLK